MRTALRLLLGLAISCSLALAAIPAKAVMPQVKISCCAMMKGAPAADDCSHQTPKSNEDKQCCSMCAFCLALLPATSAFVYSPTGEESFAAFISREHARSHRPPVPPPRA
jgi:hypothetical protein